MALQTKYVPITTTASPSKDRQADALQPWVVGDHIPFESPGPQQEKNEQDDTGPDACEAGPSRLAGLDTDGRREPIDPEGHPAAKDDNIPPRSWYGSQAANGARHTFLAAWVTRTGRYRGGETATRPDSPKPALRKTIQPAPCYIQAL